MNCTRMDEILGQRQERLIDHMGGLFASVLCFPSLRCSLDVSLILDSKGKI